MTQDTAFEVLKLGHNIFLTGPAGSGKTYLLNRYIKHLRSQGVEVAVTASTGIAATHMNGITIHSWSGMGVSVALTEKDIAKIIKKPKYRQRFSKTKVLIIDEVSMLHAHQLDMIDEILRLAKEPFLPFGGLQVILCGDFFQLPPVTKQKQRASMVYASSAWQNMKLRVCYLEESMRQDDEQLLRALNAIRNRQVDEETAAIVLSRLNKKSKIQSCPTRIFTHNSDVDLLNNRELAKLTGKTLGYSMRFSGNKKIIAALQEGCLAPSRLKLKIGAVVMFVKNNFERGYVNGTVGIVCDFEPETRLPIVRLASGEEIIAEPADWQFEENGEILASIRQVPLRLAWAITVHKSQGMTLTAVELDLRNSFEYGMGYVAFSRVKTLSGLNLLGINQVAFEVDPEVAEFDATLIEMSITTENDLANLSQEDLESRQKAILRNYKRT